MLAEWGVPPTDERLGKMNTARWVLSHYMLVDKERRWMRLMARFVGTDTDAFRTDQKYDMDSAPRIFPLAALLNPEAYGRFVEQEEGGGIEEVPDSIFAKQVDDLSAAGLLSDIDVISDEIDLKVKKFKRDAMEARLPPIGKLGK